MSAAARRTMDRPRPSARSPGATRGASPRWNVGGKGVDVIVVADRSRSLPGRADGEIRELIAALQNNRKPGDRVAVVTFALLCRRGALGVGVLAKTKEPRPTLRAAEVAT